MAIVTEKINRDKVEKQAYDFFTNAGLTPEHAAGVVGNLMYESRGNTKAIGDNGLAYGLAQWHPDRQKVFKKVYGKDIRNSSVEEQLGFVLHELKNTHKKAYNTLLTTSNPMQAGQAISDFYEAPKTKFSLNKDRQLAVANVYKKYVNNSYNPMPTLSEKITSAGDIVRATMGNLFPQNVSENTPEINATDKKEVVNAEDEIKTKQNTEDQRLLQLNNIISTIDTAYNKPIDKLNNQEYTTPYLEVPKLSYAEAEQLATQGMMQQGGRVDMYGTHLNSNIVPLNSDRSYYDSRLNTVRTGRDFENMSPDSRDRLIAHENFHAKQFKEGRSNFDIAHDTEDRQWAEMQKRPSLPSTDEEYYNYHNRKAKEVEIDIQNVKNRLPETSFFPNAANSIIFNKIVDSNQYDNPYSLEGEAQYYENTGREFDTKQQGGYKFNLPKLQYKDNNISIVERTNTQKDGTNVRLKNTADKFNPNVRNKTDKEIAAERQAKIQASVEAQKTPYTTDNWREQLAAETAATGDKLRVSNKPNFFDDYLNPAVMIGDMASNLGQAPLQAKQNDSYMPYLTSIAAPLATGALAGLGTQSTGQFVNNVVNPLAGAGDMAKGIYSKGVNALENAGIRTSVAPELRQGLRANGIFDIFKLKKPFNSEIDWSKWNKEIPDNSKLMKEYSTIEQTSKANNTWMKNPDGSPFQGTPEQFVQQNSENFKKAFPNGFNTFYRGDRFHRTILNPDTNITFGGQRHMADEYTIDGNTFWKNTEHHENTIAKSKTPTQEPNGGMYELYQPKSYNNVTIQGKGRDWSNIPSDRTFIDKDFLSTDEIALEAQRKGLDSANIQNIYDGTFKPGDVYININKQGNYLKSMQGNNGMFDMTNPNIYKSILPLAGYTGAGALTYKSLQGQEEPLQEKQQGGIIKDNMGQWKFPGQITQIDSNNITMKPNPINGEPIKNNILGIDNLGNIQIMKPNKDYTFKGNTVTEYPMLQQGGKTDYLKNVINTLSNG